MFFIVGVVLMHTLKTNYSDFFQEYKCVFWTTTLLLTIPLLFRGIFDFMNVSHKWSIFWSDKVTLYNSMFFILTDYFPILG